MADKLVVLGGTGFIGSAICRIAVSEGHEVVSVSRSGRPRYEADWMDRVRWIQGNVLQPDAWREHLQETKAVVHSVAILREKENEGLTYQRINTDSVEMTAWEAEQAGVERFVFLSVHGHPPFLPDRFIETKRLGEQVLNHSQLQELILRPALVYGPGRPVTLPFGLVQQLRSKIPFLAAPAEEQPLRVEQVATAAVRAATDLDYEGGMNPEHIAYVAGNDWKGYRDPSVPITSLRPFLVGGFAAAAIAGALSAGRR
ncbi:MAG TPA: NAD(P)-dependent oxidoreductase [Rhodothermales bacterium]|nr:NAD(P)-dependent oxidoreductase [Rhodothermales bacterium]